MASGVAQNNLRDYLSVIFRRKGVLVTTFITVMICVVLGLELKTSVYEATVKMLITARKQTTSPFYKDMVGYQQTQASITQSEIVNSNPVMERAVRILRLHERSPDYEKKFCSSIKAWVIDLKRKKSKQKDLLPEQKQQYIFRQAVNNLKESIKVDPVRDTDLFTITASDFDTECSALIANVVSRSYVIFDLEQQLAELQMQYGEKHQFVIQLRDNIDTMTRNLTGAKLSDIEAIGPASVKIVEQAQAPFEPKGHSKWLTLALAFFMSIFLGTMLTFGFEYIDQTFKSPVDVEAFFNYPVLGSIPKTGKKDKVFIRDIKQTTAYVQAYRDLSDQIYLLMKNNNLKSILITAVSPLERSSAIVANICTYLSEKAGHKVFVIDANLRSPALHKIFNVSSNPGLSGILEGKVGLSQAAQRHGQGLTILPAGETFLNPAILLHAEKVVEVIKEARESSEVVFIDYANLKNIKDISFVSAHVDGILLVVNEGQTRRHVIKALINPLEQRKTNIIGVILNNRTFAIPKILYRWI